MRRLLLFLLLLAFGAPAADLVAQEEARVSVEQENFRKTPGADGTILAGVNRGTSLPILERQGRWRKVWLRGWVWAPSVGATNREGADLVVTSNGGENLRDVPNGEILARLREGMLLERVGQVENWYQVERQGWIWAPSITEQGTGGGEETGGESAGAGEEAAGGGAEREAAPGEMEIPTGAAERMAVDSVPTVLLATPEGDTVGHALAGAQVEVTDREGDWARIRMDGWVRAPALVSPDSAAVSENLTVEALRADPDRYQGRRVRWTVRFISLERAERERSDFYEGEPFILARPTGGAEGFVYLAVDPDMLSRVEQLEPLETIEVVARVRTGSGALMGVPVLELLAIY